MNIELLNYLQDWIIKETENYDDDFNNGFIAFSYILRTVHHQLELNYDFYKKNYYNVCDTFLELKIAILIFDYCKENNIDHYKLHNITINELLNYFKK